MKTCNRCGEEKPLDEFHRHARVRGGIRAYCKACNMAQVRAWRAANPERYKQTYIKKKSGE